MAPEAGVAERAGGQDAPTVSVIVPTYNREGLLPRAIDSVLAQTLPDWECLVVDDGSTDGTASLVQELVDRDRRFRLLGGSHVGIYPNLNRGIVAARGRWIQILDDDDELTPDKLRFQVAWAENHALPEGPLVLFGDYDIHDPSREGEPRWTRHVGPRTSEELLEWKLTWDLVSPGFINQGSVLYRRSVFDLTRFDERLPSFADVLLAVDLILRGVPFVYTPISGYVQYVHGANTTGTATRFRRSYLKLMSLLAERDPRLVERTRAVGTLLHGAIQSGDEEFMAELLKMLRRARPSLRLGRRADAPDPGRALRLAALARVGARPALRLAGAYAALSRWRRRIVRGLA